MAGQQKPRKDNWSSEAYTNAAGFVPKLTTTVIKYLDAQPDDKILDIGCGDGQLTVQIAASLTGSGHVLGLDNSPSFIATAKAKHQPSNTAYEEQDCTALTSQRAIDGSWDKVFSNAALHWILRNEDTRVDVLRNIHNALKPGGSFVFEMGGKGNVAEIHTAFTAALLAHGVSLSAARAANPWFFPSTQWMTQTLSEIGFDVEVCELEFRPTQTTAGSDGDGGGLTGWLRLMGAQFLDVVEESKRESVLRNVSEVLETVVTREEDGTRWLGYVRLRAVARKR